MSISRAITVLTVLTVPLLSHSASSRPGHYFNPGVATVPTTPASGPDDTRDQELTFLLTDGWVGTWEHQHQNWDTQGRVRGENYQADLLSPI